MEIARLLLERGAQANMADEVGTCISISISLQCLFVRCVFVVYKGCVVMCGWGDVCI